jgi:putative hydrolase of the HAD superfamily
MRSKIRAIAFDLDNTLWDIEPVIARAESRLYEWLQEHCPRIPAAYSLDAMRDERTRIAREEPHKAHDLTYLRMAMLSRLARDFGYDEQLAAQAYEVFFAARNQLDVHPDVRPALERLQSHYALATLSNGNADLQRIGIAQFFTAILSARDVGAAKPDPRTFLQLTRVLGLEPREVLYVGDDPHCDVSGARAAGLRTAWMNRRRSPWPESFVAADLVVVDCEDLARQLVPS